MVGLRNAALALGVSLWAAQALAAETAKPRSAPCPTYTIPTTTMMPAIPAESGSTTDTSGNVWNWTSDAIPSPAPAAGTMTMTMASCAPAGGADLSITHIYSLSSAGLSPDSGFNGCKEGAIVGTYSAVATSGQRWTWDGSHLVGPGASCTLFLKDDGSGHAVLSATGDVLTFGAAGAYPNLGFTIKNQRTSKYLQISGTTVGAPGAVGFGATATVWMLGATHN